MEMRTATVEFKRPTLSINDRAKKRRRDPKLQITFPVLVNIKPLKKDDDLVFAHGTNFASKDATILSDSDIPDTRGAQRSAAEHSSSTPLSADNL